MPLRPRGSAASNMDVRKRAVRSALLASCVAFSASVSALAILLSHRGVGLRQEEEAAGQRRHSHDQRSGAGRHQRPVPAAPAPARNVHGSVYAATGSSASQCSMSSANAFAEP